MEEGIRAGEKTRFDLYPTPEKLLINWVFITLGILCIVPQLEKNSIMTNL